MRYLLFVFILLLSVRTAKTQVITVENAETRKPVPNAHLISSDPKAFATANTKGKVDITDFKGAETILISSMGYETVTRSYRRLSQTKKAVLKPKTVSLDQVVISASKWREDKKETPVKAVTVSKEQIQLENPQTSADLIGSSGDVFVQKSQMGGGSPMIRGFATNRVLISVDGVRMNNAIFRSGNIQNIINIDAFNTESAEVIFGPGSVTYGSDAIGGVMNFTTITPRYSDSSAAFNGGAVLRYSSANNEQTGHINLRYGREKFASYTSVSYSDFDDLRMGKYGEDSFLRNEYVESRNGEDVRVLNENPRTQKFTGYNQLNLMQKFRYQPRDDWEIGYNFIYSTTSDIPRYDRLTQRRGGELRNAEWYYGPQKWLMNTLTVHHSAGNAVYDEMKTTAGYQHFEESRHDRKFGDEILRSRTENVDVFTLNLDFYKELAERHRLTYGTEGVWNNVSSRARAQNITTDETSPAPARYPDGAFWNSYAAFLNYTYNATDKLSFRAGARYNIFDIKAEFDTEFYSLPFTQTTLRPAAPNASLGTIYRPDQNWELYANFSTGFRAPNIDDIGKTFDSEPGQVVVPNQNLQPEFAYNFESGFAFILFGDVKIDAAAYYTILDNAMVRRPFQLNGNDSIRYDGTLSEVSAVVNTAESHVYGIQTHIEAKLSRYFTARGSFNIQTGFERDEDGTELPVRHIAPEFGKVEVRYRKRSFTASLNTFFSGGFDYEELNPVEQSKPHIYAVDENGKPYSPGWYTVNFKSSYSLNDTFTFTAGVENITNVRYRTYSSGIAAPGRNYTASVRMNW